MELKNLLREKVLKNNIVITSRGNKAIALALQEAKKKGRTICWIPDQGGWLYYRKLAEKEGFEVKIIKTVDCYIDKLILKSHIDEKSVLLLHSLAGYWCALPMKEIYDFCKQKKCILINDCCGSISKKELLEGDYLVCSFGRWKPINFGKGGFIASNDELIYEDFEIEELYDLIEKIEMVDERVDRLNQESKEVISALKNHIILNKGDLNLVVIVIYEDDRTFEKLKAFCDENGYGYEVCPREIRSLRNAISIEIKRMD